MLRVIAYTSFGEKTEIPKFTQLRLSRQEDVPADSLELTLPYFREYERVKSVEVFDSNKNALLFRGICDETELIKSLDGGYISLYFRDMTALMLDNEAVPWEFINVTAGLIFEKYLAPLGFKGYVSGAKSLAGKFTVKKGTSVYRVLSDYCRACFNSIPRLTDDGRVDFNPPCPVGEAVFSACSDDEGLRYTRLELTRRPCNIITGVRVKTSASDFYETIIKNSNRELSPITRERCVDACNNSTPLETAFKIIKNSNSSYEEIKLVVKGEYFYPLLKKASIRDVIAGDIDDLYISGSEIKINENGVTNKLTLRRVKSNVAA